MNNAGRKDNTAEQHIESINKEDSRWKAYLAAAIIGEQCIKDDTLKKIFEDGAFLKNQKDRYFLKQLALAELVKKLIDDVTKEAIFNVYADLAANPDKIKSRLELFEEMKCFTSVNNIQDKNKDIWQVSVRLNKPGSHWSCLLVNLENKDRRRLLIPVESDSDGKLEPTSVLKDCEDYVNDLLNNRLLETAFEWNNMSDTQKEQYLNQRKEKTKGIVFCRDISRDYTPETFEVACQK